MGHVKRDILQRDIPAVQQAGQGHLPVKPDRTAVPVQCYVPGAVKQDGKPAGDRIAVLSGIGVGNKDVLFRQTVRIDIVIPKAKANLAWKKAGFGLFHGALQKGRQILPVAGPDAEVFQI